MRPRSTTDILIIILGILVIAQTTKWWQPNNPLYQEPLRHPPLSIRCQVKGLEGSLILVACGQRRFTVALCHIQDAESVHQALMTKLVPLTQVSLVPYYQNQNSQRHLVSEVWLKEPTGQWLHLNQWLLESGITEESQQRRCRGKNLLEQMPQGDFKWE